MQRTRARSEGSRAAGAYLGSRVPARLAALALSCACGASDLGPDDVLDGVRVVEAHLEPYGTVETVDILPASDTGTYVAAGVLVGSTLFGRSAEAAE